MTTSKPVARAPRQPNLRHGLRTTALLAWEDADAHETLLAEVEGYLRPGTPAEEEVVRTFAGILWRLRRVGLAEAAHFTRARKEAARQLRENAPRICEDRRNNWVPGCTPVPEPYDYVRAELEAPGSPELDGISDERLALIGRYEASLQRAARRQLFLLSAMRRLRGGQLIDHENMEGGEREAED